MLLETHTPEDWQKILRSSQELPLATKNYPSRGQTSVQKLYSTSIGKMFLKQVSERNHRECQVDPEFGTLAEREFWAYKLAKHVGLLVPDLFLLDHNSTIQRWLDLPDAHTFKQISGPLVLHELNLFECGLFDWVTGQIDRHDANYLYDFVNEKIILIDSAHCFLKHDGSLPDYLSLKEMSAKGRFAKTLDSKVCEAIKNLNLQTVKELIPLKKQEETMALFLRLDQIRPVKNLKELIHLYRGSKNV